MKRALHVGAAMVSALLLSAAAASAQVVVATATLGSGEETPILLSGAAGTAEVAIDTTAKEFAVTLRIFNIPTTTTAGHIHVGAKGIAGPVVIDFPAIAGRLGDFVTAFRVGEASFRPNAAIGINTIDDVIQAVANGNAYVNIHTTTNPGGEIRGQLVPKPQ
jgi:CHRD domain-containing protein